MKPLICRVCWVALFLIGFQGAGWASDNDMLQGSFRTLEKNYSLIQERLNNATAALEKISGLMPGKDLKDPMSDFSRNLDKLDGLNQLIAGNVADFNKRLDARYDSWRQQIGQIHSSAIREAAGKQLTDQRAQFQLLNKDIAATEEKLDPLIAQMRDTETYLQANLTSTSVEALTEPFQETFSMAKEAQRSLAALKGAFAQSRASISSTPQ